MNKPSLDRIKGIVPFHTHIGQRCRAAIAALSAPEGDEGYGVLFLCYDQQDDPRRPQMRLIAPTRRQVGGPITDNSSIKAAYTERCHIAAWFNDAVLVLPDNAAERARWDEWLETLDVSPQDTPVGPTDPVFDAVNRLFVDGEPVAVIRSSATLTIASFDATLERSAPATGTLSGVFSATTDVGLDSGQVVTGRLRQVLIVTTRLRPHGAFADTSRYGEQVSVQRLVG